MRFLVPFTLAMLPHFVAAGDKAPVVLKHEGWVAAVAFSPDGKTLASAGADNVVRLWEVGTWKAKGVLKGHTDCVCALAFNEHDLRNRNALATGSYDRTARLWDIEKMSETWTSEKLTGPVTAVRPLFLFESANVLTGGTDGHIRLLPKRDGEGSKRPLHKSWVNCIVHSKDWAASGSSDGTVCVSDFGKTANFLEGGAGEVRSVAFSPDGKLLAAGNRYHTVRVWNVETRKEVTTLTGHMSDVWSIAFSPDGKTLAAADTDWKKPSKVKLWDTTTWKERGTLDVPGEILSIAYSPKGEWLAVGSWDKTVRVFAMAR